MTRDVNEISLQRAAVFSGVQLSGSEINTENRDPARGRGEKNCRGKQERETERRTQQIPQKVKESLTH